MKQMLDQGRTALIHDLDGVHYDILSIPDCSLFFDRIKGLAAVNIIKDMSFEEAHEIGLQSSRQHHYSMRCFEPAARTRGMDEEKAVMDIHAEYHRLLLGIITNDHPHFLRQCQDTQNLFQALQGSVRHGLLTQSCLQNWAIPFLTQLDLLRYFESDAVLGYAECGTKLKSISGDPITLAMERLKATPMQSVFIEDSITNLKTAKEHYPDLLTVFVHHGRALEELPAHIDLQVSNLRDLFTRILILHPSKTKAAFA